MSSPREPARAVRSPRSAGTLAYQLGLGAIAVLGFAFIVHTTMANLDRLGIESGFGFLWQRAGFNINQTLIAYHPGSSIARAFAVAVLNALVLAAACVVLATGLGVVIGAARLSSNWLAARLAAAYVEIFRNIPVLLQVFFWYYVVLRALPGPREALVLGEGIVLSTRGFVLPAPGLADGASLMLLGAGALGAGCGWMASRLRAGGGASRAAAMRWGLGLGALIALAATLEWVAPTPGRYGHVGGMRLLPEFLAVALGLSIYNAAYIAEITRGGILAVPIGQREAAQSLGIGPVQTLRFVVLPQALRVMLPPLASVYVNLFKASSIGAAIGYPEIVSVLVGTTNNLVGRPIEIMTMTLAVYALISLAAAALVNRYHARLAAEQQVRS